MNITIFWGTYCLKGAAGVGGGGGRILGEIIGFLG